MTKNKENQSVKTPRRGRPLRGTEDARRAKLLAAAEDMFLEHGFSASMDDIAKAAGVSKKTIYGCVDTKEKLFEAVMQARIAGSHISKLPEAVTKVSEIEDALVQFFCELARFALSPVSVRLFRAVVGESARFPEIAATYYREGPAHMVKSLATWFALLAQQGLIALDDPAEAAAILGGGIVAAPLRSLALGVTKHWTEAEIERRARMTVRLFLKGALLQR